MLFYDIKTILQQSYSLVVSSQKFSGRPSKIYDRTSRVVLLVEEVTISNNLAGSHRGVTRN